MEDEEKKAVSETPAEEAPTAEPEENKAEETPIVEGASETEPEEKPAETPAEPEKTGESIPEEDEEDLSKLPEQPINYNPNPEEPAKEKQDKAPKSALLRPKMGKRVLSAIIDFFTAFALSIGVYALFLGTDWGKNYNAEYSEILKMQDEAKITSGYGEYKYLTDDEKSSSSSTSVTYYEDTDDMDGDANTTWYYVADKDEISDDVKTAYNAMLSGNADYVKLAKDYSLKSYLYIAVFASSGILVFYLIVPLCNKKKATLGMLIAKLEMYHFKKMKPASFWQPIARAAFILAVTYLAVIFFGITSALFVPLIGLLVVFSSRNFRCLHDFVAVTMSVDSNAVKALAAQEAQEAQEIAEAEAK